jgi:hypothetical protein
MTYDPPYEPIDNDFAADQPVRYRSVSAWAVGSLVFGLLSALTAFDWIMGLIPVVGIILGLGALQRIDRAPDELTGVAVAKIGMYLAGGFWFLGYGWQTYLYFADTPPGYHRITYEMLQPDKNDKLGLPPPAARELEGKMVFVKGYMYPGRQNSGITRFTLNPTDNSCTYCVPNPLPTEMIQVDLIHGIEATYSAKIRGVGGEFHIRSDKDAEKGKEKEEGLLYQIKADYLR